MDRVMQFEDPYMRHTLQVLVPESGLAFFLLLLITFLLAITVVLRELFPKHMTFSIVLFLLFTVEELFSTIEVVDDESQKPLGDKYSRETIDEGYPQEGEHATETGEEIGQGVILDF